MPKRSRLRRGEGRTEGDQEYVGSGASTRAHDLASSVSIRASTSSVSLPSLNGASAFSVYRRWLAAEGVSFREIAGNRGEVVLRLLVPIGYRSPVASARVLFSQPILTRANQQQVVLAVPVDQLSDQRRLENDFIRVEHVYDF
jgi:hypothetical protein